ncbi:hypothetical protein GETHLI_31510 [Geothrix limicola]|uniref:PEGA domain-containing protein n=1 Tax=Geothrix limicola TaxID=2927978 RepID=A0ABQ5QIG7_9BACT|nr:PEGA domain-containing protein [Geothrix limicola]GLH74649.1 hypothetical protein GETHLI_31510 [Geothrix limicola]
MSTITRRGLKQAGPLFFVLGCLSLAVVLACASSGHAPSVSGNNSSGNGSGSLSLSVSAPEQGYVYLDGKYTGQLTPAKLAVTAGSHQVGVALATSRTYLRHSVDVVDKDVQLTLDATADLQAPRTWKALWVGIASATGTTTAGQCTTGFTTAELDAGYNFFTWSVAHHFEPYSYGTMKWDITRVDVVNPVSLTYGSIGYTLEPTTMMPLLPQVQPGVYDAVFVFWRESQGTCSFKSNYFGLAWTDPTQLATQKTGYITVKMDAQSDLQTVINNYMANDPGVWIHEWLHTVGESFYQSKGCSLPSASLGGGLVIHAAQSYGYAFPWMNWYEDLISGRVKDLSGTGYLGIGPDALLKTNVREAATK